MRRGIAGIGRALITLGLLLLLFVAYQLWGTGIFTARAQAQLKKDFAREQQQHRHTDSDNPTVGSSTTAPGGSTTTTTVGTLGPPAEGQVVGLISIPKIGMANKAFVEGTSRDDLKKGPGHYLGTPLPGQLGNAAIAGHRTTYGAPFNRIDELQPGDHILVATVAGEYTYEMFRQLVVLPTQTEVVAPPPGPFDAWLTLTSCTPKGSASHRIVVQAKLIPTQSAKPTAPKAAKPGAAPPKASLEEGLSGQHKSLVPAIVWGIVVGLTGLGWWWAFRHWRHPLTWAVGVVPFLVVLFPFYVYLERALPSGY